MELKQYFSIIWKRLWIIMLLPIIAGSVAAYISYYELTPVYQSYTTAYIINHDTAGQYPVNYSDIMLGGILVKDYRELVRSKLVTASVLNELEITDITPSQLAGMITVSLKNDTRIIQISVRDTNPERAMQLANKTAEVFKNKVAEWLKANNVEIVDAAQTPVAPVSPNPYRNIAIAVFAGLALGLGIAFLLDYMDDTIKTAEDVEKQLKLTVLGTIPVFSLR